MAADVIYCVVEDQNSFESLDYIKLSDYIFDHGDSALSRMDIIVRPGSSVKFLNLVERHGFNLLLTTKNNVDTMILDRIDDAIDHKVPPTKVILGSADRDYIPKLKQIHRKYDVKVAIAVGTKNFSELYEKLTFIEILYFPRECSQIKGQRFCSLCGNAYWGDDQTNCPNCNCITM